MLRINLLPREVLDRHRFEVWYRIVFIVAIGLIAVVLLATAGLMLLVKDRSDTLQLELDQAAEYTEQGKSFDIFEQKEADLTARQGLAQTALADRINSGKVAEELSMVLPEEVWLDAVSLDQAAGLTFVGNTPRSSSRSLSIAYKSVAKTLVRVNELPEISDVWLASASNDSWNAWSDSTITTSTPVVKFTASAKVLPPSEVPTKTEAK